MWLILRGAHQFWGLSVVAVVALSAAAGMYIYAITFITGDWGILSGARAELESAEAIRRNLSGAERNLVAWEPEINDLKASFADPEAPLPFIEAIEGLGRRLDVKTELTLASAGASGKADSYRIVASGPFLRVATFFKLLESFPFLITIGDMEFTRLGTIAGTPDVSSDNVRFSVAVKVVPPR